MQVYHHTYVERQYGSDPSQDPCTDAEIRKVRREELFTRIARRHYPEEARTLDSAQLIREMRDER